MLLDKNLLIGCPFVCALSATCFIVCCDPDNIDPLFISPRARVLELVPH